LSANGWQAVAGRGAEAATEADRPVVQLR